MSCSTKWNIHLKHKLAINRFALIPNPVSIVSCHCDRWCLNHQKDLYVGYKHCRGRRGALWKFDVNSPNLIRRGGLRSWLVNLNQLSPHLCYRRTHTGKNTPYTHWQEHKPVLYYIRIYYHNLKLWVVFTCKFITCGERDPLSVLMSKLKMILREAFQFQNSKWFGGKHFKNDFNLAGGSRW